jgi:hypothetical protein
MFLDLCQGAIDHELIQHRLHRHQQIHRIFLRRRRRHQRRADLHHLFLQ